MEHYPPKQRRRRRKKSTEIPPPPSFTYVWIGCSVRAFVQYTHSLTLAENTPKIHNRIYRFVSKHTHMPYTHTNHICMRCLLYLMNHMKNSLNANLANRKTALPLSLARWQAHCFLLHYINKIDEWKRTKSKRQREKNPPTSQHIWSRWHIEVARTKSSRAEKEIGSTTPHMNAKKKKKKMCII